MFILAVSLPPSQPDVTDYNERSMTLKWKAPIDDGGMKITAYNIEAKTQGLVSIASKKSTMKTVYSRRRLADLGVSGHTSDHSDPPEAGEGPGVPVQGYCHQQGRKV